MHPTARHLRSLSFACLVMAVGCADAPAEEEGDAATVDSGVPGAVAADPEHYSVEFENDVVRVVRVEYGPGESSRLHRHPALCSVTLAESSWSMADADGVATENGGTTGEFSCSEATVHNPTNSGSSPNEVVLIELKEGAGPGSESMEEMGAVAADPDHYSVEFENSAVRILRIRYAAGESGVLHSHPANCVVWLSSAAAEGDPQAPGQVNCIDGQTHTPNGGGEGVTELVAVEFKGRATLQD